MLDLVVPEPESLRRATGARRPSYGDEALHHHDEPLAKPLAKISDEVKRAAEKSVSGALYSPDPTTNGWAPYPMSEVTRRLRHRADDVAMRS